MCSDVDQWTRTECFLIEIVNFPQKSLQMRAGQPISQLLLIWSSLIVATFQEFVFSILWQVTLIATISRQSLSTLFKHFVTFPGKSYNHLAPHNILAYLAFKKSSKYHTTTWTAFAWSGQICGVF